MKKKVKPVHAVLSILGVVLVGFLGLQALALLTGKHYFDIPSDRAKLRAIREPLLVIPPALDAHQPLHGDYPDQIADLDSSVPRIAEIEAAFRSNSALAYQPEADEYMLYLKLNMDGGLWFDSASREWVYDAGLGDPSWTIDR